MVIITAVYIPPQVDTDIAPSALHDVLCRHQTQYPDVAVVCDQSKESHVELPSPHYVCYQGRKNFGSLINAIQERLQGSLPPQVGPCRHFPAA